MQREKNSARWTVHRRDGERIELELSGSWTINSRLPEDALLAAVAEPGIREVGYTASGLEAWDSMLVSALYQLEKTCRERQIASVRSGLPESVQRLLRMTETTVADRETHQKGKKTTFAAEVGE